MLQPGNCNLMNGRRMGSKSTKGWILTPTSGPRGWEPGVEGSHTLESKEAPALGRDDRKRWLALLLVCTAQLMIVLDGTIVNVALPAIRGSLGFSQVTLSWVVNAYLLTFGGFLLLGGRAGDLFGRRRVFAFGLALFTFASLLRGLAGSQVVLVAARALQGVGGAIIAPAALSIIITAFKDPAERARAMGVWAFVVSGGASVGLLLSAGLLVGFAAVERRTRAPLVPPGIFARSRNLAVSNVVMALAVVGMVGWFFFSALYLQRVLGYDSLATSLAYLPATVALGAISQGPAARAVNRLGIKSTILGGMGLMAAGLLFFARAPVGGSFLLDVLPGMLVLGVGAAFAFMAVILAATAGVPQAEAGPSSRLPKTPPPKGGALG